jgi:prenyltransferase beta subunit
MLQVARLSPKLLGEATELVAEFVQKQHNPDGGFGDRSGASDLYYTVFGIECLRALRLDLPVPRILPYLESFGIGDDLDFVHRACLARCWAHMPAEKQTSLDKEGLSKNILAHRSADGAFDNKIAGKTGTVYASFLALGALQDLQVSLNDPERLIEVIHKLKAKDGGYANQASMPMGLTPPTTAAVAIFHQLGESIDPETGQWLLSRHYGEGGFFATPMAPVPDLLSTATALHALAIMKVSNELVKEPCLDFIDTLWTNRGGFFGTWGDDHIDCEYTYYALLALGHLSL